MIQVVEQSNSVSGTGPSNGPASAPRVVIIGAGIAGLSCGCYLQMNGIQTEILESHELPGGLCTSWKRGHYMFDGCLRWLTGALPPSFFHQLWSELGAIAGRKVFVHEDIFRIEAPDGRMLTVPANLVKLGQELKRVAPEDGRWIDRLIRDALRCMSIEPLKKPIELMPHRQRIREGLRLLPIIPIVLRWKNLTLGEYLKRYQNDFVRKALRMVSGTEEMSALVLPMVLAFRARTDTGFVVGGSWDFAMAIAERYQRLGGVFRYNTKVTRIQVENGHACGVECEDGTFTRATTVISCADGHATIYDMLGGRFLDKKIRFLYEKCQTFHALIQISLGIKCEFPDTPHTLNLILPEPVLADDQTSHDVIEVELFDTHSGLCAPGTTLLTTRLPTRHEFWMDLRKNDPRRYRTEKRIVLRRIIAILDKRFPGLAKNIERFDIATPATFVRYTHNWRASYEGWLPTPQILGRRISYTLPGLKNFYMAGHWVVPGGGLPSAALSGREVAQLVCAEKGKAFHASSA